MNADARTNLAEASSNKADARTNLAGARTNVADASSNVAEASSNRADARTNVADASSNLVDGCANNADLTPNPSPLGEGKDDWQTYFLGLLKMSLETCLYCALVTPKTDLTYFFTSKAISTKPRIFLYSTSLRAMRALLSVVAAFTTAVLADFIDASKVFNEVIVKSVSLGA